MSKVWDTTQLAVPLSVLFGLLGPACAGCTDELPPVGEVVVPVGPDMPVPRLVVELRIDLFDEEGRWFASREVLARRPEDWPVGFSLWTREQDREQSATVRLRAYPAFTFRDYLGERYEPQPDYSGPWTPRNLQQLCQEAPEIIPPRQFDVRRGSELVTEPIAQGDCGAALAAVTGVHVGIREAGRYRFEVINTVPSMRAVTPSDNVLFLRTDCSDPTSQLACNDDHSPAEGPSPTDGVRPAFEQDLAPGRYTLFVGSKAGDSLTDVVVRVAQPEEWDEVDRRSADFPPRLLAEGLDISPRVEPQPLVTIDRLVQIRLVPGTVARRTVVMRGACTGTMARLSLQEHPERLDVEAASSCVATEGERVALGEETDGPFEPKEHGSFGPTGRECVDIEEQVDRVCVPSGTFILGDSRLLGEHDPQRAVPERLARMGHFWIDRTEVSVGRFRAAVEAGFPLPGHRELSRNPAKLGKSIGQGTDRLCTWSDTPMPSPDEREDYALSCIERDAARAFCRFEGGDLPTEAQWEYVASSAGRPAESLYPARDSAPACTDAVFGRFVSRELGGSSANSYFELEHRISDACGAWGPLSLQSPTHQRDRIEALGVVGMAGGVSEWVRDAAYSYEHACWRSHGLDAPACLMEEIPAYAVRGGSFAHGPFWLAAATRGSRIKQFASMFPSSYIGFRCVYSASHPGKSL
jgi:formylglycine-generating enzyme required for sulfatase activity